MSDPAAYDRYSMIIEWEPQGAAFVVTVPELPGCRTHGATYEEAVEQGQLAIESWIDATRYWGYRVPPPSYFALDPVESRMLQAVGTE